MTWRKPRVAGGSQGEGRPLRHHQCQHGGKEKEIHSIVTPGHVRKGAKVTLFYDSMILYMYYMNMSSVYTDDDIDRNKQLRSK